MPFNSQQITTSWFRKRSKASKIEQHSAEVPKLSSKNPEKKHKLQKHSVFQKHSISNIKYNFT
jgi:hypothetical protein